MYLLDTNILSEPLYERPDTGVMARLERYEGDLATATTAWHELLYGIYRLPLRKRRCYEHYLRNGLPAAITILPYDAAAAAWHARERARLAALGKTPPFADGQIAAVAAVNKLVLVTRNLPDFAPFESLRLESWHGDR